MSTYNYTLIDIGMVIEHLMGGAFRSTYCRKRFRQKYNALKRNVSHEWRKWNQEKKKEIKLAVTIFFHMLAVNNKEDLRILIENHFQKKSERETRD